MLSPPNASATPRNRLAFESTARELEALRQEKIGQSRFRWGIGIAPGAVASLGMFYSGPALAATHPDALSFVLISLMGLWIGIFWFSDRPRQAFRRQYKEQLFSQLLKSVSDLSYSRRGAWSEKKLHQRRLVPPYHRLISEDHFTGIYKQVGVHLSEAELQDIHEEWQGNQKNTRQTTLFKGLFIELSLPRPIPGKIVIVKDYGVLLNKLTGLRHGGLERISLEDPHFESFFEVYGDNQIAARQWLTPAFMERLVSLLDDFKTTSLALSAEGNELFLVVPSSGRLYRHNRFETPSFRYPITADTLEGTLKEVLDILRLIDVLKLS